MRILDLFCGVGGASNGYADRATVVGIDHNAQPDYQHEFIRADVTMVPRLPDQVRPDPRVASLSA